EDRSPRRPIAELLGSELAGFRDERQGLLEAAQLAEGHALVLPGVGMTGVQLQRFVEERQGLGRATLLKEGPRRLDEPVHRLLAPELGGIGLRGRSWSRGRRRQNVEAL